MATWTNWSGRQKAQPAVLHFAYSEADVVALVQTAGSSDATIRVAGAGHSHSALVGNDQVIVDCSGLAGVIDVDATRCRARVWAGTPIHALGRPLHDAGLALNNQGDIDRQSIAGAVATGTHGTGVELQNLSASVVGARLVLASGETVECGEDRNPELLRVARLNLGAVGIVTQLELGTRTAYRLAERGWTESFDALIPQLETLASRSRHFEFFWHPDSDTASAKAIDETEQPTQYPLAEEGARVGWSYEVLPNHRPHKHTEMEYSVAERDGPGCLAAIRELIRRDFPDLRWPVEYRTLAEDDVWLSTAYQRPTVTISVHQDIREDDEPYFRACEEIFLAHGGRPHWGKVNYLDGDALAACHPRWNDWWAQRDALDPDGLFLNGYLQSLRPGV